ncbi:MAG TPA: hypothetical protein VF339_04370 [Gammaproteobacteria bacterium]
MTTTRRTLLRALAGGALMPAVSFPARAQNDESSLLARVRRDLEHHAAFGYKFSGSPGDLATANWIAGRLRAAGYDVEESTADMPFWDERIARLDAGSASVDVQPQAPVVPTGPSGVTAPLVVVEDERSDVRGRIAVFLTPFGRHAALAPDRGIGQTVVRLAEAGASAIVIVTRGPSGEAIALNVRPSAPFVPIPTAVLAPKDAATIIEAARSGAEGTLILDGDATRRPSPNIVARLERGDRWIAVSTPRSGWYHCVGERGTGTAAFLEIAAWAVHRFPQHSIWLLNSGGHEYYFAGSEHIVDTPPPEDTRVWVHIGASLAVRDAEERNGELVMLDTPDPRRTLMATDTARDAVAESFKNLPGYSPPTAVGGGELPLFLERGYTTAFATIATHAWFHTIEDTLSRVDERHLVPVIRAYQRGIELIVDA